MKAMEVDELRTLMVECMGGDADAAFAGEEFLAAPFADLDFDSLARVELAEQLKTWTGLALPNDFVDQAATAGELLERINDALAGTVGAGTGEG